MSTQEQIVYKPLNYEKAINTDPAKNNRKILVNKEQNVADVIAKNEHVDIPFLYKEQTPCYHEKKETEKFEFSEGFKPLKNYPLNLTNVLAAYHQSLQKFLDNNKTITLQNMRQYLLVRAYIFHHLSYHHSFRLIGKALSVVHTEELANKVRALTHDKYTPEEFFYPGQQKFANQREVQEKISDLKILNDKYYSSKQELKDLHDVKSPEEFEDLVSKLENIPYSYHNPCYIYYNLESIRVTNLVIDEIIAGTRQLNNKYDVAYYFKEDESSNKLSLYQNQVYSLVPKIDLELLKKEAGLTDDVLNGAKKVAAALVDVHKQYIKDNKGVKNMNQEPGFFYKRHFDLFHNPIDGDYVYLSIEWQQFAYTYLNTKFLGKAN